MSPINAQFGGVGGIPLGEKLLGEYMRDAGYATHVRPCPTENVTNSMRDRCELAFAYICGAADEVTLRLCPVVSCSMLENGYEYGYSGPIRVDADAPYRLDVVVLPSPVVLLIVRSMVA